VVPLFEWCLYLVPYWIWSLFLAPLFGVFIWCLYLVPSALARVEPFFEIRSKKAPNKGTKWCLYLVPSWLGAFLSGAFLEIRCSAWALGRTDAV
jgi:hypothetical protein